MKRFFVVYCLTFFAFSYVFAQGELDKQGKVFYRNEKSIAILLNSNGFGLSGRYAKRINAASKNIYDLDIVILKHPKEFKQPSEINPASGSNFVYGKQYIALNLRPGIGKQKEIFRKFDVGGISVRRYYTLGPTVSFLKPIYYDVRYYPLIGYDYTSKDEKFSDISQGGYINGRASFFKGFDGLKLYPGAYAKFGLSFEYSKLDLVLHSIDVGVIAEGFLQKLPLMATKENNQFFLTLFISYRLGKVIDSNAVKKKTKSDDFF